MSDLTDAQRLALLELFSTVDAVFDEDAYTTPKAMEMSLRRIARSHIKARVALERNAETFGRAS